MNLFLIFTVLIWTVKIRKKPGAVLPVTYSGRTMQLILRKSNYIHVYLKQQQQQQFFRYDVFVACYVCPGSTSRPYKRLRWPNA